jgi:hypothetical protein
MESLPQNGSNHEDPRKAVIINAPSVVQETADYMLCGFGFLTFSGAVCAWGVILAIKKKAKEKRVEANDRHATPEG